MTSTHDTREGPASLTSSKRRAWQAGFAAVLMLSCSPVALHAETSNDELAAEIKALRAQIREMKSSIAQTRVESRRTAAKVKAVASRTPYEPEMPTMAIPVGATPAFVTADKKLQFGAITITPGGYVAAESVYRSRALNSDVNSPFGSIPFPNSSVGHTNEFRPSARQTRLALLTEGAITPTMIAAGYVEFDMLGAAPTANSNETNSYTPRIRNLYATLDAGDYGMHVLAGQNWSLVTLNSKGITPRNEVTPNVIDANQNVGSLYARQPQIRLTKDFDKKLWVSLSAEESETTFAPGCTTPGAVAGNLNPSPATAGIAPGAAGTVNSITCGTPGAGAFSTGTNYSLNHVPDVIGKVAYEGRFADRDVHLEAFGMYTDLYDRVSFTNATTGLTTSSNKDTSGYGVGGGVILAVLPKRLDFQLNGIYGRGVGRYGPTAIAESTYNPDGSLKAVPEVIAMTGLTFHATPSIDLYTYAGIESTVSSYFQNPTSAAGVPGTFVGIGAPSINDTGCKIEGSTACTGSTKLAYELTGGFWDKVYKGPFGEVRAGIQYSYVQRQIFNGTTDGTVNTSRLPIVKTDEHMVFTSLRYYPFQ